MHDVSCLLHTADATIRSHGRRLCEMNATLVDDLKPAKLRTVRLARLHQRYFIACHVTRRGANIFIGRLQSMFEHCFVISLLNKSSAVAEMSDRGHNGHGQKRGRLLCPFRGSWDPVQYNVAWAEVYFRTKWRLQPLSR